PTFRGPIKNRSCTDVICCVLFLVFIAGYIVVGLVAWLYGDPRQVLYPRNSTGAYYIPSLIPHPCSSSIYPLALISSFILFLHLSGLLDTLNAREISTKIFEDIARSWYWILIALAISLVLSLLFLLLLRLVAGPLVLVLILGVLGVLAYGIYHCWKEYKTLRDKGATISQLGFTTNLSAYQSVQETWLVALILISVLEGILLLLLIFLRQRIRIAIALLEEASKAVGQMMSTLFFPLLTFVLLLICVAYWVMTALYPLNDVSDPLCCQDVINKTCNPLDNFSITNCPGLTCQFLGYSSSGPAQRSLFNLQIYGILGLFWTLNWVLALGQCVLAGAFASFYWAFNKPQDIPSCPLTAAFFRTLRYHTGSLAFGALILTLVQIVRVVLEYLDHKLRGAQNSLIRCLMCCLKCCFWCLEKFIKFLNRNAYIMIAVYGKNFCISAKNAFMLLMRNIVRSECQILTAPLPLHAFFFLSPGILSFFFFTGRIPALKEEFRSPDLNYYWLPIMVSILGAYVIASGFFSVFSMCVDTLFLCFLEDLERNDGSLAKPYYMSKNLMKILGKKNERPSGEKRKKAK
uniref:Choline transporter-like protein n=1 Tax=Vombatus ursinus TaxID=29139 RepID=A0A4X2LTE9_VOMUR